MTPLDFFLGAVFVITGFGILSFSFRFADRLPLLGLLIFGMKAMGEPAKEILKAVGMFTAVLAVFLFIALSGSMLFAKGLLWLLPL